MTKKRDLKLLIRKRTEKTGESYSAARRHVENMVSTAEPNALETTSDQIKGWFPAGPTPEDYEFRIDHTQGYSRPSSALIRSRSDKAVRSSTKLMQHFLANDYRGHRLRLSGWVKSEGVTGSCRLWMRLDENTRLLLFAGSSPITATSEWTRREVVLDVDQEATLISIGIALDGAGAAWLADVGIEIVEKETPTTASRHIPVQPRNLNFSE